ncbi:MAG TPA: peptidase S8, partial [bacterium]|nr:peptidase S8 [bacterium]
MKTLFAVVFSTVLLWSHCAGALVPRATFSKPVRSEIRECDRWDLLVVKFNEGTAVRLRDGVFVSEADADVSGLHHLMTLYPDIRVARLFQRPEAVYETEKITGETRTGRQLADLNLYYAFGPKNRLQAEALLADLNALDLVETAYPEPIPALPVNPAPKLLPPLYVDSQDYLEASPIGVDAYAAWNEPGGRGENVKMVDVELAWVWTHQDLPAPFYEGGTQNPDQGYRNHGTAVMGEIAGIDNAFGITGIANQAAVGGQAINIDDWPDNVGSHFDLASAALDPGDVWLIELHGPGPGGAYIAMEWWQANYDAIANST